MKKLIHQRSNPSRSQRQPDRRISMQRWKGSRSSMEFDGSTFFSLFRRYSGRDHRSNKRSNVGSPVNKRHQRSYSHSSGSSSPSASPKRSSFSPNKPIPSTEFSETKPSNPHGDSFPYDEEIQQEFYPYNPEVPDLDYDPSYARPSSFMPNNQRTLVTVVTNADPLPSDSKHRHHDGRVPSQRIHRTKRHVVTTSFANADHRERKRPCKQFRSIVMHRWSIPHLGQKSNGSHHGHTTLEIRKIPLESNTISKLNEHFSKFGTVTNVQVRSVVLFSSHSANGSPI